MTKKLLMIVAMFSVVVAACGKESEIDTTDKELPYVQITDKDLEMIDYVNQNSDYVFALFEEMDITENEHGMPYTEESDDATVHSYGFYLEEEQAIIRTQISLNGPSDRNILGVHIGDTYKDARELMEKAGFTCTNKRPFNSSLMLETYSAGIVEISMLVTKEERNNSNESVDDDIIQSINITIPLILLDQKKQRVEEENKQQEMLFYQEQMEISLDEIRKINEESDFGGHYLLDAPPEGYLASESNLLDPADTLCRDTYHCSKYNGANCITHISISSGKRHIYGIKVGDEAAKGEQLLEEKSYVPDDSTTDVRKYTKGNITIRLFVNKEGIIDEVAVGMVDPLAEQSD